MVQSHVALLLQITEALQPNHRPTMLLQTYMARYIQGMKSANGLQSSSTICVSACTASTAGYTHVPLAVES